MCDWRINAITTAGQAIATQTTASSQGYPPNNNFVPYLIIQGFNVSMAAGTAAHSPVSWNIIDGTSGAANIIMSGALSCPANQSFAITQSDMNLRATSGFATIQFNGTSPAAAIQAVSMWGFTESYGGQ